MPTTHGTSERKLVAAGKPTHDYFVPTRRPPNSLPLMKSPSMMVSPQPPCKDKSIEPTINYGNFLKKKSAKIEEAATARNVVSRPVVPADSNTSTTTPIKKTASMIQPTTSGFSAMNSPKPAGLFPERQALKLEDFQMGKQLGKGKFGEVFLVKHKLTGFLCALKVISKRPICEDKLEQQMARELKILSFVRHPNLIACYGYFDDTDNIYVLMELCSGGHLFKQIQDKRRLPEAEAAYLIKQVCEGVKYLHSLQILHRDIKPENIILENGIAKICDFGWSVFSGGLRKTVCGTPLYLSPEVVKGEDYDEKIDLWAVGILTYELLIGRIPFKIWSEAQLNRIVSDEVTFPDYIEVSEAAKDFILKILEKEPGKRRSLHELLEHPFLAGAQLGAEGPLLQ